MKIAVIGATGKAGNLIVKEAVARGHEVTAIVRDRAKVHEPKVKVLEKDIFALTYEDIKDDDVIINAFGVWAEKDLPQYSTSTQHLADILSGKPNRLLIIGGAGSLYVNPEHTLQLVDSPEFPAIYKPLSSSARAAYDELKARKDVKWTYFSPAAEFVADGPRTGKYTAGGDELTVNSKGKSQISYADYAIAMVDEAENGKHIGARFTAVSE